MLFPQELLDAIVEDVHDVPALKACSLAASVFRQTSQRILLSCLTLLPEAASERSYGATRSLLDESPHIASYITRMHLDISDEISSIDIENLIQILKQLTNVERCALSTSRRFGADDWKGPLGHLFSEAILEFLMRQPLHNLSVRMAFGIPAPVFFRLMMTAPNIDLGPISVQWPEPKDLLGIPSSQTSTLKCLAFGHTSESAAELLDHPTFAFHTAALNDLTLTLSTHKVYGHKIIYYAAHTIEHIRIAMGDNPPAMPSLPTLPALRYLEVRQDLRNFVPCLQRFVETITTFLASSNEITELFVLICVDRRPEYDFLSRPDPQPEDFAEDLLLSLDNIFMAYPTSPSITWHFKSLEKSVAEDAVAPDFVTALQRGLPKMLEAGRLVFTECHATYKNHSGERK
ncbi:hypothetical protein DFH06DRAFT_757364 [Mycena polygramma]|nr:hypothetical protein DFH06DRAFT_757364 [Mycena polygramma]